jgi:3-hydroxybutyryl-CoA dehydrogenase
MMNVEKIVVIGAGQMGAGIAQVAATHGHAVTLTDVSESQLQRARQSIHDSITRLHAKGRLSDEQVAQAGSIQMSPSIDAVAGCDLVIEAVSEDVELKQLVLSKADVMAPPQAILASNTSSIAITQLGRLTHREPLVIGMHFFNPVPLMQPVEVVRGELTSDETVDCIVRLAQKMGKTPVVVKDAPGFISNRVLCPMINEAIFALQEGIATREGIDTIMKLGMNHPMGPLALADLIGLDTLLAILEVLHQGFGDDKYVPAPLLRSMVAEGKLGRKTGHGFYEY